jgi:dolichyl-phosphate beta-glucosyltransferase
MSSSVSIIIPAYNEEANISKTLRQVHSYLTENKFDFEIIVVNDGSSDNTVQEVQKCKNAQLIDNPINTGKGNAVKRGVMAAKNELILFMDADHAIPIHYLSQFTQEVPAFDIIIGSKYIGETKNYPFYRKIVGKVFSFLKFLIIGLKIKDTQCGFKLFKAEIAKEVFSHAQINGWCFDVEILMIARRKAYTIKESPINMSDINSISKINIFSSGTQMFLDLIKLRLDFKKGKYKL